MDPDVNRQSASSIGANSSKLEILGKTVCMQHDSFETRFTYSVIEDGLIVFLSAIRTSRHAGKKFWEQNLIWSNPSKVDRGFARKFMDFIVEKHGSIQTSKNQRTMGKDMWKKFIASSLPFRNVYYGSFDDVELHSINTVAELNQIGQMIWGNDKSFENFFVRVTKNATLGS